MINKLKKLKKRVCFALYCMPHGEDEKFVEKVKKIGKEYNVVSLETLGDGTGHKGIYLIDLEESHSGFFADYNKLLQYLYFADCYHLTPVVKFSDRFCYAEKHQVNGTSNPFEYYYKQPSEVSLKEALGQNHIIVCRKENTYLSRDLNEDGNAYHRSDLYIAKMAEITAKYIRLNDLTKEKISKDIEKALRGKKTLAVHVRGTDFKHNYNGHPIKVSVEEYAEAANLLLQKNTYEQIFIATDDMEAVELFQKKFGNKVVFFKDVVRSSGNESVMNSQLERENHHYFLGLEVLRDMYALSSCNGLVAGLSQVSYAARIQKKSSGSDYEDIMILDKGINYHRKSNCPK